MRLWHYKLLPYLPDLQFKGQFRELVAIVKDWRDKGKTNHLLINKAMEYPKEDLMDYFLEYAKEYNFRYGKISALLKIGEFDSFASPSYNTKVEPFKNWHDKNYLRVCMVNLYEKRVYGVGKSRITEVEWKKLLTGYKQITGEEYII